ncbi:hypothetical protein O3Q51_13505 [Cryomorphaceae bacterium 1068]|nr:hypothetical protein [Cryomorphaceae bacterium 1068]
MHRILKYPIVLLTVSLLWLSCAKDEVAPSENSVQKIKVFQDEEIFAVNGMVAGEGSILLVYTTNADTSYLKLTDNQGVEKWTVNASSNFGIQTTNYSAEGYLRKVIHENGVFTFFIQNGDNNLRILRIDKSGSVISEIENFTNENTSSFKIFGVQLNSNGNYVLYGSITLGSDNRCYFAEITPAGDVVFRSIYTPFGGGTKGFSGLEEIDGGYYLGGYFRSNSQVVSSSIFLVEYSISGELVSEEFVNTPISNSDLFLNPFPVGRELIKNLNGSFSYLISSNGSDQNSEPTLIFNFSNEGQFLDSNQIDFLEENYLPGISPFFGEGIIKLRDGSHIGVGNADFGSLLQDETPGLTGFNPNYNNPRYSFIYELNTTGQIASYSYLQREVFNYISCLDKTSDGKIVAAGTSMSFGTKPQLSILWLK